MPLRVLGLQVASYALRSLRQSTRTSPDRAHLWPLQQRALRWIGASAVHRPAARHDMDVTRKNFAQTMPHVREALSQCSFFAIDCEFTGLHLNHTASEYYSLDLQERYREWSSSARSFIILQFGLSAFVPTSRGLEAVTYNFWLFPRPSGRSNGRFMCQAGSLQFLSEQGFDFNKCIASGISSMPAAAKEEALARLQHAHDTPYQHPLVPVTKSEDVAFVSELQAQILLWLQGSEAELDLDEATKYRRSLQWQTAQRLQAQQHSFHVRRAVSSNGKFMLRLLRGSQEECQQMEDAEKAAEVDEVHAAAGFTAVVEAMRDSGKPAVVHNGMFDLHYSLQSFAGYLPRRWGEFKAMAMDWFPGGIYDTKYLIRSYMLRPELKQNEQLFPHTSLGDAYRRLQAPQFAATVKRSYGVDWIPVRSQLSAGSQRYAGSAAYAHEAGYDAWMTGVVFANLAQLRTLQAHRADPPAEPPGSYGGSFGSWLSTMNPFRSAAASPPKPPPFTLQHVQAVRNRINVANTDLPYADLAGPDPVPFRAHVFHVVGHLHNMYQVAYEAQALLGLGRPWLHRSPGQDLATMAFPCNTPETWQVHADVMMAMHANRVPHRALSEEQRRDPRWVAATLLQQLPQLAGAKVWPHEFYRLASPKRKSPSRPGFGRSDEEETEEEVEPEAKRGAVGSS